MAKRKRKTHRRLLRNPWANLRRAGHRLSEAGGPLASRSLELTELETRVLYSAAPVADLAEFNYAEHAYGDLHDHAFAEGPSVSLWPDPEGIDWTAAIELDSWIPTPVDADPLDNFAQPRTELVVLDASVDNYEQLRNALLADSGSVHFEVLILDSQRDGIQQITAALARHENVSGIHIISHGSAGRVQLGNSQLSNETLDAYAGDLAWWNNSLRDNADILFYGCNLAASADGTLLLESVAALTGADVGASNDLTGSADWGGDWDLEYALGVIETHVAFSTDVLPSWTGVLATVTFQEGTGGYTGAQDTYLSEGQPTTSYAGASTITVDLDQSGGETQGLIRFDNIFGSGPGQIPFGYTINSATLTLEAVDGAFANIDLHRMLVNWNETDTWNLMTNGLQSGTEYQASADGSVPSPLSTGTKVITGLEATVQAWAYGATNHGWAFITNSTDGWDFNSSEFGTVALRPVLTVDYSAPTTLTVDTTNDILDGDTTSIAARRMTRSLSRSFAFSTLRTRVATSRASVR